jgi:hypothetical protein
VEEGFGERALRSDSAGDFEMRGISVELWDHVELVVVLVLVSARVLGELCLGMLPGSNASMGRVFMWGRRRARHRWPWAEFEERCWACLCTWRLEAGGRWCRVGAWPGAPLAARAHVLRQGSYRHAGRGCVVLWRRERYLGHGAGCLALRFLTRLLDPGACLCGALSRPLAAGCGMAGGGVLYEVDAVAAPCGLCRMPGRLGGIFRCFGRLGDLEERGVVEGCGAVLVSV